MVLLLVEVTTVDGNGGTARLGNDKDNAEFLVALRMRRPDDESNRFHGDNCKACTSLDELTEESTKNRTDNVAALIRLVAPG
jgi:hypothetical protein